MFNHAFVVPTSLQPTRQFADLLSIADLLRYSSLSAGEKHLIGFLVSSKTAARQCTEQKHFRGEATQASGMWLLVTVSDCVCVRSSDSLPDLALVTLA
jgi:hypothetical protein